MDFLEIGKEEFTNFVKSNSIGNFYQSVNMESILRLRGKDVYYVGVKKGNKLVCASIMSSWKNKIGLKYFDCLKGPLMDFNDKELVSFFTDEVKKFAKKKGGYAVRIDPLVLYKERDIDGNIVDGGIDNSAVCDRLEELGYKHVKDNGMSDVKFAFILDIDGKSDDELFKNFKQNHRNIINKTERYGIVIKELDYDELPIYKKITEDTSERRGFHDKSLEYYQVMYKEFVSNDMGKFLVAYLDVNRYIEYLNDDLVSNKKRLESAKENSGRAKELKVTINSLEKRISDAEILREKGDMIPLSAALFIMFNGEVTYLFSGSYKEYMNFYAQYAIQWYMIRYAAKNKYKVYNFFGINDIFNKGSADYGVYEFKKGFNGRVVEYVGAYELPVSWFYNIKRR